MTIQDFIIEAKKDTLSFLNYIYDDVIELTDQEMYRIYFNDALAALYRYDAGRGMLRNEKMLLERG